MSAHTPILAEADDGLAMAMVASSNTPLLLLDGDLGVIGASTSFCRAFQVDEADVRGHFLFRLGDGEWDAPQLRALLNGTLAGTARVEAYAMDLSRKGEDVRRLVINVRRLDFSDDGQPRLLLTASDVTGAHESERLNAERLREKDSRLQEESILLEELGSRLANSLQIIASVLMQRAQRVASDETRGRLFDGYRRVMSPGAIQKQLTITEGGPVHVDSYLNDLCDSLAASMIRNPSQISMRVKVDGGVTTAEASVSLGLIVTELVINALRHAFPNHRVGKISVNYLSRGGAWTLSVADDGIGMGIEPDAPKTGLGTSLIEVLAKHLNARVVVADAHPGVAVSIVHR
jgi:two-component sensor histidine kinase